MDKKTFREEYEKIEVPKEDVLKAIQLGIKRGKPKRNRGKIAVISTVAAAVAFFSVGFSSPTMSHVMADIPLLGKLYVNFNDSIGRKLASQEMITELNQTVTNHGIDVTITSAYFDGAMIGITFDVQGDVKKDEYGYFNAFYEIYNGDENIDDSKEYAKTAESDTGFTGLIAFNYPEAVLPADTTIPVTFKEISGQKGNWTFNIPIKQLAYETVNTDKMSENKDGSISMKFDSIIRGQSSTAINYTVTFLKGMENDQIRMDEVYDDQGKPLQVSSHGFIPKETIKERDKVTEKGRAILPLALAEKSSYLEIRPMLAMYEPDQYLNLNEQTPIDIQSERQELSVKIEEMTVKDEKLIVDFQMNNGKRAKQNFNFYEEAAKYDIRMVKDLERDIYQEETKHTFKTLAKDQLRFRKTYNLSEIKDFNKKDYVIRVNLNSMSSNSPVELPPVKIKLK